MGKKGQKVNPRLRGPGLEPGSKAWEASILTLKLSALYSACPCLLCIASQYDLITKYIALQLPRLKPGSGHPVTVLPLYVRA